RSAPCPPPAGPGSPEKRRRRAAAARGGLHHGLPPVLHPRKKQDRRFLAAKAPHLSASWFPAYFGGSPVDPLGNLLHRREPGPARLPAFAGPAAGPLTP